MKHLTSVLWLIGIFSISSLQAQTFNANASTSFTVWTVKGEVNYTDKGSSKAAPVTPGMTLEEDVTVNVGEKSSVSLVRNKDIVQVNKKGNYSLNGADISKFTRKQSEATTYFFQQLIASTKLQEGQDKLTEKGAGYGDGGSVKNNETGAGYGDGGSVKSTEQGAGYGDGGGVKNNETGAGYGDGGGVKNNETGAGYGDGGSVKNNETGAGYGRKDKTTKMKMKKAIAPLKADPLYKKSKKVQKLLMKAAVLEKAGLNGMSAKYYKKALSKNADDAVAKLMYKAFLERNN